MVGPQRACAKDRSTNAGRSVDLEAGATPSSLTGSKKGWKVSEVEGPASLYTP